MRQRYESSRDKDAKEAPGGDSRGRRAACAHSWRDRVCTGARCGVPIWHPGGAARLFGRGDAGACHGPCPPCAATVLRRAARSMVGILGTSRTQRTLSRTRSYAISSPSVPRVDRQPTSSLGPRLLPRAVLPRFSLVTDRSPGLQPPRLPAPSCLPVPPRGAASLSFTGAPPPRPALLLEQGTRPTDALGRMWGLMSISPSAHPAATQCHTIPGAPIPGREEKTRRKLKQARKPSTHSSSWSRARSRGLLLPPHAAFARNQIFPPHTSRTP